MNHIKQVVLLFFKGAGMGAANVIPGVSGGTIALITGVFERLINALKSLNIKAISLFFKGQWKEFAQHTDFWFLVTLFAGVGASIFSLAKLLDFLFTHYPVYVWSYFFGLIIASVYSVGRTIKKWSWSVVLFFLVGAAIAIGITFAKPASENDAFWYLIICGVVAVCSMILPGISGSFVLLLMGNYQLFMIHAVSDLNLGILLPVVLGAIVGLIAFSHFLSWLFRTFPGQTLSSLTGFMFGSLLLLWPWKGVVYLTGDDGMNILNRHGEPIPDHYNFWLPEADLSLLIAIACIVAGLLTIILLEIKAKPKEA